MSQTAPAQTTKPRALALLSPRFAWLHLIIIAALMVSRRPDAILHPQFWAEDGQVFYHDAYTNGLLTLWTPRDGYLQSFSRLVSLFTVHFPLAWGPAICMIFAAILQLAPIWLMLSARMNKPIPSYPSRLIICYFYAVLPNSYELNLNLTNAQWHIAILTFLLISSGPARRMVSQFAEWIFLAIAGLTGPFSIFLTPIIMFDLIRHRTTKTAIDATILTMSAIIQLTFIVMSQATLARRVTPLGASLPNLFHILINNIILGGLVGNHLMRIFLTFSDWNNIVWQLMLIGFGAITWSTALSRGPIIFWRASFFAACILTAALISPVSSKAETALQWPAMARPGYGMRYDFIPTLVWFGAILTSLGSKNKPIRLMSICLCILALAGAVTSWSYRPFTYSNFTVEADEFSRAPAGTLYNFVENPPGWDMTLTKK